MNFNKLFIESFTSKIPEILKEYDGNRDICENLAYVFCGIVLIPFIEEKYSKGEFNVIKTILNITEEILEMNNKEMTDVVYLGILENTIPDRELHKGIEKFMPEKLLHYSREFEKKLGW